MCFQVLFLCSIFRKRHVSKTTKRGEYKKPIPFQDISAKSSQRLCPCWGISSCHLLRKIKETNAGIKLAPRITNHQAKVFFDFINSVLIF
jgi:hypothetical protein